MCSMNACVSKITLSLFLFLAVVSPFFSIAYTNDSEIVEVGIPAPDNPPPENTVSSGSDSSQTTPIPSNDSGSGAEDNEGADFIITFNGNGSQENGTAGGSPSIGTVEVTSIASGQGNTATSNTTSATTSTTGTSSATDGKDTATSLVDSSDILVVLLGNQAFVSAGSGSSFVSGGGGDIRIYADRVRDALHARNIAAFSVPDTAFVLSSVREVGTRLTQSDFVLFASSAILKDEYVQDIVFFEGMLTTEYRALGRLFGVIPLWYRLRVVVDIGEGEIRSVSVKFPWYVFFLSTGVSRASLERELRLEIDTRVGDHQEEFDIATRAFTAVVEVLRLRVGV